VMEDDRDIEAAEEAKIAAYMALQNKWMATAFKFSTTGICIAYVVFRSLGVSWPTLLTSLLVSDAPRLVLFVCAVLCIGLHVLIFIAVHSYRERLGYLRDSDRIPPVGRDHRPNLKVISFLVGINELSGLIMVLFRWASSSRGTP
jgi:hypothetical protein